MSIKIGIIVNNQYHPRDDPVMRLEEQYLMIRHARDKGWHSALASMHYLQDPGSTALQQVPLLARLQAEAGEMTMGVAIYLLNLHNPVYTAETMATLDIISRGRLIFGIGLGYRDAEFNAFGVPKGQRVQRMVDYLALIKRLWSEDNVTAEGPWGRVDNATLQLRPIQKPHPPLWIAANHDNAVKRAAHIGDCWYINPHATLETNRRQMKLFVDERKAAGLPLPKEIPCRKEIFCARDRRTALEMAGPYLEERYRIYSSWGQEKAMPKGESFDKPFEELANDRFVIGSPEDCYEQLRPYWEELGVNHFVFRTYFIGMPISNALHSMHMISDELLPALRRVRARPLA
jgi:alkanesulfonate monooxygenase SsuD/methylene tetrahydromethanopterin reductase-like flavin-dependent oxidoreductase (luciferase family)